MRRTGLAVVFTLSLLALFAVEAQQTKIMPRIGVLSPGASPPGLLEAFREGLRDLGYVDGQTATIEWRFAEGKNDRLAALADELVRLKVDVIFAVHTPQPAQPRTPPPPFPSSQRASLIL